MEHAAFQTRRVAALHRWTKNECVTDEFISVQIMSYREQRFQVRMLTMKSSRIHRPTDMNPWTHRSESQPVP